MEYIHSKVHQRAAKGSNHKPYEITHEEWKIFSGPGSFHDSTAIQIFLKGKSPPISILTYLHRHLQMVFLIICSNMLLLMQPSQQRCQLLLQQLAICVYKLEQPSHVHIAIEHGVACLPVQPRMFPGKLEKKRN